MNQVQPIAINDIDLFDGIVQRFTEYCEGRIAGGNTEWVLPQVECNVCKMDILFRSNVIDGDMARAINQLIGVDEHDNRQYKIRTDFEVFFCGAKNHNGMWMLDSYDFEIVHKKNIEHQWSVNNIDLLGHRYLANGYLDDEHLFTDNQYLDLHGNLTGKHPLEDTTYTFNPKETDNTVLPWSYAVLGAIADNGLGEAISTSIEQASQNKIHKWLAEGVAQRNIQQRTK